MIISLNISKIIQTESELKENSLIVYYDLVLGLTDLKKLYIGIKDIQFRDTPTKMFFSKEWIKNVAKISGTIKNTDKIYKLYGYLEMVGQEVNNNSQSGMLEGLNSSYDANRYYGIINKVANIIFSSTFLKSDMKGSSNEEEVELDISKDLHVDYSEIILDLRVTIDKFIN